MAQMGGRCHSGGGREQRDSEARSYRVDLYSVSILQSSLCHGKSIVLLQKESPSVDQATEPGGQSQRTSPARLSAQEQM